jgi:signal transduction histidine kinase/ligand-binding sensor domain-containing protein
VQRISPPPLLPASRAIALGCFAFLVAGSIGRAAPPADYFYRTWRIDNGLPANWVNTVVQDPQGYLWLATLTGLSRFDGRKFEDFPLPAPGGTAGNVRALAQEDPSTLVMIPASGGVVRLRNGVFSRHPASDAVARRQLEHLFAGPDGTLWFGDINGDILRWQDGKLSVFGQGEGIFRSFAGVSVATDARGRTWVAEGDYLGWFGQGRLTRFPTPAGVALVIAPARAGGIWISAGENLYREDEGRLVTKSEAPEWTLGRDEVRYLFEDREGVLWIATYRHGLFQFASGQVRSVPTQQQILSCVTEDAEGGIWVASVGGGITRLQPKHFVLVHPGAGQPDIASTAVCADASGAVWCANRNGGVFRYVAGAVQPVDNPPGEAMVYANAVCPDAAGTVWVGAKSGLYRVTGRARPVLEPVAPELKDIHLLYFSRQGELLLTVGRGRLLRRRQGIFEDVPAPVSTLQKPVGAIAETSDGALWVGRGDELDAYRDGRLVREAASDGLRGETVNALHGDRDGALWLGTDHGILRFKDRRLASGTPVQDPPHRWIRQILEDDAGNLWLGSLQGYFHVPRADLDAVADGRLARAAAVTFGPEEGLTGQTPLYNCQPNVWRTADDHIWFCTQDGVLGIDANATPLRRPAPPVYVGRVVVDGREAGISHLRLTSGDHRLGFYFSSPNFAAPEKVRLRYRLVGYDRGWNETVSDQEVNYTGLPAGRYTLEVDASDSSGLWREGTGDSLAFTVVPLWWEAWWSRAAALALFTLAIAWLARDASHRLLKRRLRQIEQEHALEKERARIARDLHDELGGSLTRIALRADRLRRRSEKSEFGPGLSQLARQARRLSGELESIIWTVNPRNNSLDRFASYVRHFALRFFHETAIACSVLGIDEIPSRRITPEVQHHLLSVTKEALTNVLKHSQAGTVTVRLGFAAGHFTTVVRDNGAGFEVQAAEHSERNGLSNMRSRLREIGGAIAFRSSPDGGTEISWSVPVGSPPAPPAPAAADPAHS